MNENIFQVLTEHSQYGYPVLQNWYETMEEAEAELEQCKKFWPDDMWWIEPGTEHINDKCEGCGTVHSYERQDAYGIFTGHYCDDCYENNYPYRKDRYDYEGAGERLEDDY